MSNKTINLVANVVMPITVIIVTAILFFMFRPEKPGTLFYLNLGYTIFLEIIFFGYFNVIRVKSTSLSVPFFIQLGITAGYYIVAGFCWMLVYSLLLSLIIPLKIYIAGLMVITLIWFIIGAFLAQTDSNYKETTDKLKADGHTLQYYAEKMNVLASQYEKLCEEKGIRYETSSNNRSVLDNLKNKMRFLTPNVLSSETACSQLKAILEKCEDLIEETGNADGDKITEMEKKMQRFVNNSIDELNMLKNLTRR